jgi:hypothetical protein
MIAMKRRLVRRDEATVVRIVRLMTDHLFSELLPRWSRDQASLATAAGAILIPSQYVTIQYIPVADLPNVCLACLSLD